MDSSQAPLMSDDNREDEVHDEVDDRLLASSSDATKPAPLRPGFFVVLLTFAAGLGGLLFGYDTGVISATLVSMGTSLSERNLTSMDKSIITSSTALFALLVSPFSSFLADKFGRRAVVLCADILFIVGAIAQAYSFTITGMVIGRCMIGAAVGAASFAVPLYLAEVAPASHRGRVVTTNVLFITLGQVVAYIIGWAFSTFVAKEIGWRWMVGLGAVPAAFQGVIMFFMPETPRWLVKVGRSVDARAVVLRIHAGPGAQPSDADAIIKSIEIEAREEAEAQRLRGHDRSGPWKWLGVWKELVLERRNRRALAIACLLQGLQQLCGFNSLMYFSATIFTLVGFRSPTLISLTVAVTNFVFTLAALGLIDRVGRRRILLYSIPFMIVGLLLAAYGFSFIGLGSSSSVESAAEESGYQGAATLILISIMLYCAAYAIGLGNVPWMQSELFPLSVRSVGSGIATATNWGANFVIGLTFLLLMDSLTPSWTFVLYAAICGVGYGLIWGIYPEMSGMSLEQNAQVD